MSLLSEGLSIHASRLHEAAGELVTYRRGADTVTDLEAVRGQTRFEELPSEMDATIQTRTADWLIEPSNLILGGVAVKPSRGDQVITSGGDVFDVFPGADDKHWRYADQFETHFRIHSVKRV